MADILISKFTTQIPRVGATPATPGFAESEGQDPVAPSGTPQVYTPVTIGSPANGLSIDGTQVLTIGLASNSATGALSSTDWNTFNNKLNLTSPITGYTVGADTALAATDTILQAFGKVQGQINARISGTIASGQVAFGTGTGTIGGSTAFVYDFLLNNLGIGRFSPTYKLDVASTDGAILARFSDLDSTHNGVIINADVNAGWIGNNLSLNSEGFYLQNSINAIRIYTNSSEKARLDSSGNLGIGTISPFFKLDVAGDIRGDRFIFRVNTTTPSQSAFIFRPATGVLAFGTSSSERMRITDGNLVGILTTSPTNTLDVNGTARIRTISNLGSAATSVLVPSATGVLSLRTLAELASDMGVSTDSVQTVATSGTINDLALTGTNVIFTGTSVTLNGMSALANAREVSLTNFTGSNLTISGQNTSSLANNRFTSGFTILNGQTVKFKYLTNSNRWFIVSGFFVGILEDPLMPSANGLRTDSKTGFGRFPLLNATLSSRSSTSDNTQSALYLDNSSGTRLFSVAGNGLADIAGQLIVGGGTSVPLTTYSLWVTAKGNTSSQGTIYLQNTGGSLLTVWDGAGDQRSVGGATFGVQRVPTGRVEIRGKGTSTVSTLSLEDSGGTLNASFLDNGQIRFLRLPTSSAGLAAGDLWNDNGNVRIGTTVTFRDQESVKTTASADQTLPSGTLTILDYDSTLLNNSTATYTVATDGRITINITGVYTITAGVVIEADAVTALESAFLGIFRNGDLVAISSINTTIAAGAQSGLSTSTILSLTATDIIDCRALVNSVGGVANGLARRLGTLLGANATQVNSLSITKNSM